MCEIYKSIKGRKKSYIIGENLAEAKKTARRYFHCTDYDLFMEKGWLLDEELYLDNPHTKGACVVWVVSYRR